MSALKYRHLSRSSSHRQALLRNLVTSLIEHETISTTFAKAKEAQRVAEKLITLGKRNTGAAKHEAQQIFYVRFCYQDSQSCDILIYLPMASSYQKSISPNSLARYANVMLPVPAVTLES